MAEATETKPEVPALTSAEVKNLKELFKSYVALSNKGGNPDHMQSKAAGKITKDCWKDLALYVDTVAFPKCKEQGKP